MNNYYVYIYYRLDTNEPFYVGKGHGYRWRDFHNRKSHFMNIINKIHVVATIEKDNLTEQEAFYWEEKIIEELVFEYGFSIDIPNNRSRDHYCHLVNQTWGGEGGSGHNPWENKTEEEMREIGRKISEALKGRKATEEQKEKMRGNNNPMYGKHHSEETRKKISEINKGKCRTEEFKRKLGRPVICLTTKRIFYSIAEASEHYNCDKSHLSQCCKNECKTCGKLSNGTPLVWMFLEDYKKASEDDIRKKIEKASNRRDKRSKAVICFTTGNVYASLRHCAKSLNIDRRTLSKCCKGEKEFIIINGIEHRFGYFDKEND